MMDWLREVLPAWAFDPTITSPIAVGFGFLGLIVGIAIARWRNGGKDQ